MVGPDVREFAKQYTAEGLEPESPKDRLMIFVIVVAFFIIAAFGIGLRLTNYLGFSLPWYAVVGTSVVAAAAVVFWIGRSR